MTFVLEEGEVKAGPGAFVLVPPGVEHGFRNDGDSSVRMLNIHAPGASTAGSVCRTEPARRLEKPSTAASSLAALDGCFGRSVVKLVIGIVRPEKANDVLEALYRAEVRGLSMSRVQGHGGELDRVETYRGTTVKMGLSEKVRFEIAVSDAFVEPTIEALCEGAPHRRGRRRQDLRRARSSGRSGSAPARPTTAP